MSPLSIMLISSSVLAKWSYAAFSKRPTRKQISNLVSNSLTEPLAMYKNWTNSLVFFLLPPPLCCLESRPQLFVAARLDQTVLAQGNSQVPYTNPQRNPYRLAKL